MRFSVDEQITFQVVGGILDLDTNKPIDGVIFADDITGVIHRYVFNENGQLQLDEDGEPLLVIETRNFRFLRKVEDNA